MKHLKNSDTKKNQKKNKKIKSKGSNFSHQKINLDRFAGSSEEEENDYDEDVQDSQPIKKKLRLHESTEYHQQKILRIQQENSDNASKDNEIIDRNDHDEEEENEDESASEEEDGFGYSVSNKNKISLAVDADDEDDSEVENDDDDSYELDSDDVDEYNHDRNLILSKKEGRGQVGMADAMSRILGIAESNAGDNRKRKTNPTTVNNIVLSKTITPLQKRQLQEKQEEEALKNKQKQRRDRNLIAMHIPASALSFATINSSIIHAELELERAHRRVATRGVVALFNAITQHQHQKKQQTITVPTASNKNSQAQKPMTKYGFLEMIKNSANVVLGDSTDKATRKANNDDDKTSGNSQPLSSVVEESHRKTNKTKTDQKKGWNALKDDFMMNSKLKDWDKEFSDEDFDDESSAEYNDRREGVGHDDDDFMDDDD